MDLTKVIAITGKPGLFRLVSQLKGGFIVEEIASKKKISINAQSQVSLLQNISIYTQTEEIALIEVFKKIAHKNELKEVKFGKDLISQLRKEMEQVLPEYDKEKVYDSDLKKLFSWYNVLLKEGVINAETIKPEQKEETIQEEVKPKAKKAKEKIENAEEVVKEKKTNTKKSTKKATSEE